METVASEKETDSMLLNVSVPKDVRIVTSPFASLAADIIVEILAA